MKVRTIYVRPGDILNVRFVYDEEAPLTRDEWKAQPRIGRCELSLHDLTPQSFTLFPNGAIEAKGAIHFGIDEARIAALEKDAARYETVRKLNAEQFAQLFRKNIETGVHFDVLVDEIAAMKGGA
jgi:hypothetical protein